MYKVQSMVMCYVRFCNDEFTTFCDADMYSFDHAIICYPGRFLVWKAFRNGFVR